MKAIVHIGTEKTGTSSIQAFLYQNQGKLKASGFHFIQSAGKENNRALPAYCMRNNRTDDFFNREGIRSQAQRVEFKRNFLADFERELSAVSKNIHTCIISSEHLHSKLQTEEEIDCLYRFLTAYFDEIDIICYLREQVSWCTSYYSSYARSGGTDSFTTMLMKCKPDNLYYNHFENLSIWERYFGLDALDVSLFSQDHFLNGTLLDDLTAKIDSTLVGTLNKSIPVENESLRPIGQALARAVNIAFPVSSQRAEVIGINKECKRVIAQGPKGKGQQPSLAARQKLYNAFIESNELLRQKYFPKVEMLFSAPSKEDSTNLVGEDDIAVIVKIFDVCINYDLNGALALEFSQFYTAMFSCLNDVMTSVGEIGIEIVLQEKDAILLGDAARHAERRNDNSALRLMTLASKANPNWSWAEAKLKEYQLNEGQKPKPQFMLSYHRGETPINMSDEETLSRFQEWVISQNHTTGRMLTACTSTRTINQEGIDAEGEESTLQGCSIIYAESMDAAYSIAKGCPFLELGGHISVTELSSDWV